MNKQGFLERYGKWAVVAGASEGLGAEYAARLAGLGLNLVLIARRADRLEALAKSLAGQYQVEVECLTLDLSSPGAAATVYAAASQKEIGLLVYNAGFSAIGAFLDRPLEDHFREVRTNIQTPLELVYLFAKQMQARGRGGILFMSSLSSFQGSAFISTYGASKAFTTVLAEGLWEELRAQGVDVLVCIASAVRTPGYIASSPRKAGGFSTPAMEPAAVAAEALEALGRGPYVIPGRGNRLASFIMRHLLPRRTAVRIMGGVLRQMYVNR